MHLETDWVFFGCAGERLGWLDGGSAGGGRVDHQLGKLKGGLMGAP